MELKCEEGKRFLPPIKDLFDDKIVVYDLTRSPNFEQITRMMEQETARLDGAKSILPSLANQILGYREICQKNDIAQSMSGKGNCLGNSVMESFFDRVKTEYYLSKQFDSFERLTNHS